MTYRACEDYYCTAFVGAYTGPPPSFVYTVSLYHCNQDVGETVEKEPVALAIALTSQSDFNIVTKILIETNHPNHHERVRQGKS